MAPQHPTASAEQRAMAAPNHHSNRARGGRHGGLQPRIRLTLLAALGRRRREGGGAVMGIVLLVVFGVTLSAVAIANQIGSGAIRAPLMGQSREAREAAEAGIMAVISEMNKVENRQLLVEKPGDDGWNAQQRNACLATPEAINLGLLNRPPSIVGGPLDPRNGNIRVISDNHKYVVQRIEVLNPNRSRSAWWDSIIDDGQSPDYDSRKVNIVGDSLEDLKEQRVGYIRITVEGQYFANSADNEETARALVTREFQVVPKCCFKSFGPGWIGQAGLPSIRELVFGPDDRDCTERQGATGLIAFGGSAKTSGRAARVLNSSDGSNTGDTDAAALFCILSDDGSDSCDPSDRLASTPVVPIKLSLREAPVPPAGVGGGDLRGTVILPNADYCRPTWTTRDQYIANPDTVPPSEEAWECVVNNINATGSGALYILNNIETLDPSDSSRPGTLSTTIRPVRLWVNGNISLSGTYKMNHFGVNRIPGTNLSLEAPGNAESLKTFLDAPANRIEVNAFSDSSATNANFNDFHLYGPNSPFQRWGLGGTPGTLAAFLYGRYADCQFSGNIKILGQIWCRSFDAQGNAELVIAPSDFGDDSIPPSIFDFTARSTWGSRLFGR
jgi:hypothetical protein